MMMTHTFISKHLGNNYKKDCNLKETIIKDTSYTHKKGFERFMVQADSSSKINKIYKEVSELISAILVENNNKNKNKNKNKTRLQKIAPSPLPNLII
jgi:hypothetical protein